MNMHMRMYMNTYDIYVCIYAQDVPTLCDDTATVLAQLLPTPRFECRDPADLPFEEQVSRR